MLVFGSVGSIGCMFGGNVFGSIGIFVGIIFGWFCCYLWLC